jgi:hypothetical protein
LTGISVVVVLSIHAAVAEVNAFGELFPVLQGSQDPLVGVGQAGSSLSEFVVVSFLVANPFGEKVLQLLTVDPRLQLDASFLEK